MIQRGGVGVLANHGVLSNGGVGMLAITAYCLRVVLGVLANHGVLSKGGVGVLANHGVQSNEGSSVSKSRHTD